MWLLFSVQGGMVCSRREKAYTFTRFFPSNVSLFQSSKAKNTEQQTETRNCAMFDLRKENIPFLFVVFTDI